MGGSVRRRGKNGTTGLMLLIKIINLILYVLKKTGNPITPMSIKYMSDRIHAKSGFPFNFIVGKIPKNRSSFNHA